MKTQTSTPGGRISTSNKPSEKLVSSPTQAKREKSKLRQFRDRSENTPSPGDTNARSAIAGQA